jgi:hypothetical protein
VRAAGVTLTPETIARIDEALEGAIVWN